MGCRILLPFQVVVLTEVTNVVETPSPWTAVNHELPVESTEHLEITALCFQTNFTAMEADIERRPVQDARNIAQDRVRDVETFGASRLYRLLEYLIEHPHTSVEEGRWGNPLIKKPEKIHRKLFV